MTVMESLFVVDIIVGLLSLSTETPSRKIRIARSLILIGFMNTLLLRLK